MLTAAVWLPTASSQATTSNSLIVLAVAIGVLYEI